MSAVIAVMIAQMLDPIRILLMAMVVLVSRLAPSEPLRWLIVFIGACASAWLIAQILSAIGVPRNDITTVVGVVSNLIIAAIILGLLRLFRRRKPAV